MCENSNIIFIPFCIHTFGKSGFFFHYFSEENSCRALSPSLTLKSAFRCGQVSDKTVGKLSTFLRGADRLIGLSSAPDKEQANIYIEPYLLL